MQVVSDHFSMPVSDILGALYATRYPDIGRAFKCDYTTLPHHYCDTTKQKTRKIAVARCNGIARLDRM